MYLIKSFYEFSKKTININKMEASRVHGTPLRILNDFYFYGICYIFSLISTLKGYNNDDITSECS